MLVLAEALYLYRNIDCFNLQRPTGAFLSLFESLFGRESILALLLLSDTS